jgi:hypothetical protein
MSICFSIMPFDKQFSVIDRIIGRAARSCDLQYQRGDRLLKPGSIVPQVLRHIRDAAVIVADITGNNANVFYELGMAHHIKGPGRVVILRQARKKAPYDVHEFRHLTYLRTAKGYRALREELPKWLQQALASTADEETWKVVRDRLARTRLIVRDLRAVLRASRSKPLSGVTIRIVAGLSSLAISDHELVDGRTDPEYFKALIDERNSLRDVLLRGARLKAVLTPPRQFAQTMSPERLRVRFERLIGLLEGRSDIRGNKKSAADDIKVMKRCQFTISPVPMPNLFIIDDRVAYEGLKRGGAPGFAMTHCETDPAALRELITTFDDLFKVSERERSSSHSDGRPVVHQLRRIYRQAVAAGQS